MGRPRPRTVENTFEAIRQTIVHSQWFKLPGTEKSYSPNAIVSIEVGTGVGERRSLAAERLGQGVREHVIDPISEG